ncbi:MAG: hypothetical protein KIS92_23195 [Planctomycetota bacterium]|nr:hypothetical protein [Planctomycetota bacterium]
MSNLPSFDAPRKILITMFLIVLSCGFLVAHLYLHHAMAGAGGEEKFMPSPRDIAVHFHGDRTKTRLKTMSLGSMKRYFMDDSDRKPAELTPAEQAKLDAVIAWNDAGAPESGYWDPTLKEKTADPALVYAILGDRGCYDCHSPDAAGKFAKRDSPLDSFKAVSRYTKGDTGMDKGRLLMLSHVHLLGMAMMFLGAGAALVFSTWSAKLRGGLVFGGFFSILLDIGGWWAVKYGGAAWAWTVIAGGTLMGAAFGLTVLAVLYDLWLRKPAA